MLAQWRIKELFTNCTNSSQQSLPLLSSTEEERRLVFKISIWRKGRLNIQNQWKGLVVSVTSKQSIHFCRLLPQKPVSYCFQLLPSAFGTAKPLIHVQQGQFNWARILGHQQSPATRCYISQEVLKELHLYLYLKTMSHLLADYGSVALDDVPCRLESLQVFSPSQTPVTAEFTDLWRRN